MIKIISHTIIIILFTVVSQLGGLAWLIALNYKRRILVFIATYCALSLAALWIAPMLGREPLPCISGNALRMQSTVFCILNRQYVVPELKEVLTDYAARMEHDFPNTTTRVLDANFPFVSGFPLLPHLSHDDGRKVDLAFYYEDETGYLPNATRSPIGYFAFEQGPTDCPDNSMTLRWDLAWLQNLWPNYQPEALRMKAGLQWLGDDERVGKVFIEPHLRARYEAQSTKIRFQGCRAARHDDHIHVQL
ncbi:hypothetical protein [Cohaesibacter celericrescens]|uniref:Uncharacterized protein n=1 Tax=Cohaesibacter celericrescens TaxID=2067669 RepID=A0A2N5XVD9_9HYPH|nr:hypothetical protein [Cohaesibacter celericrescens]PLW78486.1 hypothetical protein C0081_04130 [Cohaesibacter celericrescens]